MDEQMSDTDKAFMEAVARKKEEERKEREALSNPEAVEKRKEQAEKAVNNIKDIISKGVYDDDEKEAVLDSLLKITAHLSPDASMSGSHIDNVRIAKEENTQWGSGRAFINEVENLDLGQMGHVTLPDGGGMTRMIIGKDNDNSIVELVGSGNIDEIEDRAKEIGILHPDRKLGN